ncbi:MAG: hypothetical protein WCH52_05425 [Bacteroidota bacterium]
MVILFSYSCSKNETSNSSNPTNPTVQGRWNFPSARYKYSVSSGGVYLDYSDSTELQPAGSYLTFNADGTVVHGDNSGPQDTTNYTVNNNLLILSDGTYIDTLTIQSLTANTMNLYNIDVVTMNNQTDSSEAWINLNR